MDDLVAFLRAQLDEDEQIARSASVDGENQTETGEHWHWVETEHDVPVELNPVTDEFVNDGSGVALRSVERYPSRYSSGLPHFVISEAEEVPTICGMHIARHDPARVLAEVKAKRLLLESVLHSLRDDPDDEEAQWAVAVLATPYADHPDYRAEWAPAG